MTRALVIGAALALAGCSFINDWGSLTTDPNARRDGGGIDGGTLDGGEPDEDGGVPDEDGGVPDDDGGVPDEDAGPSCVDACAPGDGVCTEPTFCGVGADGCTLCVACEACDACPDTCVFEPDACFCDGGPRPEGSSCGDDADCAEGLGCLASVCHRRCSAPGDDVCPSESIYPHCVWYFDEDERFCIDEPCRAFPVNRSNAIECTAVGFPRCAFEADSSIVCVGTGTAELHRPCAGSSDCAFGLSCLPIASTSGTSLGSICVALCDPATGGCEADAPCDPLGVVTSDGLSVGACTPVDADADGHAAPHDCDDASTSVWPGNTEDCFDGLDNDCDGFVDDADFDCSAGCTTDAECSAAEACAIDEVCRPRGEEGSGCIPDGTCSGSLTCEPSSFRCFYSCVFDFECTAMYGRCVDSLCRYRRSGQSCTSGAECESGDCMSGTCP